MPPGVAAIVIGAVAATLSAAGPAAAAAGQHLRDIPRRLGRSILLGRELLVAADIIRSVAIDPAFDPVGVHGCPTEMPTRQRPDALPEGRGVRTDRQELVETSHR
ncbi:MULTISPECIES: DUF1622 domain-containing protein [unclassified Arthrobacter]|uniref:DUF1622 domain-containing protein n=1 Tax=unclassified Arthrobacter TaxID=235627 RepID=UPI0027D8D658|nr:MULTISPECIES: DUF1622 domain-containing protein [unclassified Arthrobacter]